MRVGYLVGWFVLWVARFSIFPFMFPLYIFLWWLRFLLLFISKYFCHIFLVTWSISNSILFWSFIFSALQLTCPFGSYSDLLFFQFCIFFPSKNNVNINSIKKKVIKKYEIDALMAKMPQKHIFRFSVFSSFF